LGGPAGVSWLVGRWPKLRLGGRLISKLGVAPSPICLNPILYARLEHDGEALGLHSRMIAHRLVEFAGDRWHIFRLHLVKGRRQSLSNFNLGRNGGTLRLMLRVGKLYLSSLAALLGVPACAGRAINA